VHQAYNGFRYVNGTPADCVHIALTGLLGYRPDLVAWHQQRRQHGRRHDLLGHRGCGHGRLSVRHSRHCFSQVDKGWGELEAAAQKAADMVRQMLH
jgi:5'-nucleotidase